MVIVTGVGTFFTLVVHYACTSTMVDGYDVPLDH